MASAASFRRGLERVVAAAGSSLSGSKAGISGGSVCSDLLVSAIPFLSGENLLSSLSLPWMRLCGAVFTGLLIPWAEGVLRIEGRNSPSGLFTDGGRRLGEA